MLDYNVESFRGNKALIVSNSGSFGGENNFLSTVKIIPIIKFSNPLKKNHIFYFSLNFTKYNKNGYRVDNGWLRTPGF